MGVVKRPRSGVRFRPVPQGIVPVSAGNASHHARRQFPVYPIHQNVVLNGFGFGLTVDPCCLAFTTNMGDPTPPQTVTMTNQETRALQISSQLYPPGQGFAEKDDCQGTLAAGATCHYTITFTPVEPGVGGDSILITDNAPFFNTYGINIVSNAMDFAINAQGSLAQTVNAGQKATYDLSVAGIAGFSGSVALSCSGAIPGGSCTVSPAAVNVDSGQSPTFTVTVTTVARTSSFVAPAAPSQWWDKALWSMAWTLLMGCAFCAPWRKRTGTSVALFLLLLSCSCGGGATSGGGGGTGGSGGTGGGGTGTPETYNFTITGTAGQTSHTAAITLTVN